MSNVGIYTSQNIFIDFRTAGIGDRMAAFLIDSLIIAAYLIFTVLILDAIPMSGTVEVVVFFVFYMPVFFYHLIFEFIMNGQTPGKRQMKIRVLKEEGQPASVGAYLLRWILSPIDFLLSGGIAITCIIMTEKAQRLGDLAAGTIVVKEKKLEDYNKSFLRKNEEENYEPVFSAVKLRLEQSDIDLIQEVLRVRLENTVNAPAEKLRTHLEKKLEVQSELTTVKFLHTIIKDFKHYHSEE